MNSFYGGREGAPFIIRKSYIDVPTMIEDFGRGLSNSEVRFGEFVIINTEDKNHPDNGKVFRRNFMGGKIEYYKAEKELSGKYIKEKELINGNGAEYIGSIVGPAGAAPHFQPVPFTTIDYVYENEEPKKDENGDYILEEVQYDMEAIKARYPQGAYDTKSGWGSFGPNLGVANLLPGKTGNPGEHVYRDIIDWESYSVRTPNADDTTVFMDLRMTYPVIEFNAQTVDPYFRRDNDEDGMEDDIPDEDKTNKFYNVNLVDALPAEDGGEHPFYQRWMINIPKGIKGQSIKYIKVIEATDDVCVFTLDENGYIIRTEQGKLQTERYPEQNDDVENKRQIIVAYIVDYDRIAEGDEYVIYIGDYNMIDNIVLEDDGEFRIQYAHDNDYARVGDERLTWITGINLNTDNGHLDIDTNNEMKELHTDLTWVKDVKISDTGYLDIETTTETNETHKQLHWIKDIDFSADGTITTTEVDGKTQVPFNQLITWIDEWSIDPNTKELYISLNNESHLINGTKKATTIPLETVNDILIEDGNKFVLQYNTFKEGKPKIKPLGRFIYQGNEEPDDLITGGLWIETIDI